jgi:mannitol/fructose-specific phosphotransferase system IIA component (Ntr-type)
LVYNGRARVGGKGVGVDERDRSVITESADPLLSELFQPTHVIPELKATTREGVITEVVKQVAQRGLVSDAKWLEAALTERERMVPTAMPNGVAFLHARHRAAEKFPKQFLFLARSGKGVSFGSPDERPTHLFFLLALRRDMAHLRWLARLSWICRNRTTVANLLKVSGADEIARLLRLAVEELPGNLKQK